MEKIPTLFERTFENHRVVGIADHVIAGMEWVVRGEGIATIKWDGACCAIINGELYKRYDAKKGKTPPFGAIPCCDPDPITGHHPHWVKCEANNPADKWFLVAAKNAGYLKTQVASYRTYEAIGKHFNGNPYGMEYDTIRPHGVDIVNVGRTFEEIKQYLAENDIEGLVFWRDGKPACKIKKTDFGLKWR